MSATHSSTELPEREETYEEIHARDVREFPYSVFHEEGEGTPPKFKTWKEALSAQKQWNKACPGHRAFKRNTQ